MNGMVRMVIKLLIAVSETDNAKSAFARCEIKLDVGPPGQAARIIMPTAISDCSGKSMAIAKPMIGNNTN